MPPPPPDLDAALAQACREVGLADHYEPSARRLIGADRWPRCCGGGCEPCAVTLVAVAKRVHELLGLPVRAEIR